jgi:hypothetical protein
MKYNFYTYAYLRKDGTPYYIGKGKGNRAFKKGKGEIQPPKDKSRILFLKTNLAEDEAFKHEIYMITVFGRKDLGTGTLWNFTDGGEGVSGLIHSEETKKKQSEANSGENSPLFGVPKTEEQKKKQSEAMSGKYTGEKHPQYGNTGALHPSSKAIIAITPDGTELHFGCCIEAAKELGINPGNLSGRYLKTGKSPTEGKFKGWRFVYENS